MDIALIIMFEIYQKKFVIENYLDHIYLQIRFFSTQAYVFILNILCNSRGPCFSMRMNFWYCVLTVFSARILDVAVIPKII